MKTTKQIIEELAKEYLESPNYHYGWIDKDWINKVTEELNLENLSDLELSNMWDMVYLTLDHMYHYYHVNEEFKMAMKYLDVQSAFTEVVNREARQRREKKKEGLKMKVLVLSNGELEMKEIENTLENLQKIVGGYIEVPYMGRVFFENGIDIIINEEGKFIEGLHPEIAVVNKQTKQIEDIVYGNCIFASHDKEGNTIALNDNQIKVVMEELQNEIMLYDRKNNVETFVKVLFI